MKMCRVPEIHDEEKIVTLNVGGQIFSTTKNTLTSIEGTIFQNFFNDRFFQLLDSSGHLFIDRSPRCFGLILDYMRMGHEIKSLFDLMSPPDLYLLLKEAEYYCIEPLYRDIKLILYKPTRIEVEKDRFWNLGGKLKTSWKYMDTILKLDCEYSELHKYKTRGCVTMINDKQTLTSHLDQDWMNQQLEGAKNWKSFEELVVVKFVSNL
jgi:hypothetical protein